MYFLSNSIKDYNYITDDKKLVKILHRNFLFIL